MPWWVVFNDGSEGCLQGVSDTRNYLREDEVVYVAANLPSKKSTSVKEFWRIPENASPILDPHFMAAPPFCRDPKICRGKNYCTQEYSCND